MKRRIAFLGPVGTFTEQAAVAYDPGASRLAMPTVEEAAEAMQDGRADEAVVPMENSLQGSVTATLDLLIHEAGLSIRNELVLPISHCLLSKAGVELKDIRIVYSHPQALAQCRGFISENLPNAQPTASLSTAAAVEELESAAEPAAAIAAERASAIYGVPIVARSIEDNTNNVTRFVALGLSDHEPTGNDKTSLCWTHEEDLPGLLYGVLKEFSDRGINLTKIESRPHPRELWGNTTSWPTSPATGTIPTSGRPSPPCGPREAPRSEYSARTRGETPLRLRPWAWWRWWRAPRRRPRLPPPACRPLA